jgi:hypothetical protein
MFCEEFRAKDNYEMETLAVERLLWFRDMYYPGMFLIINTDYTGNKQKELDGLLPNATIRITKGHRKGSAGLTYEEKQFRKVDQCARAELRARVKSRFPKALQFTF